MPLITLDSNELLMELINNSNPDADPNFDVTNLQMVGDPVKLTIGDVTNFNTNLKVSGINGVYKGSAILTYRRLDVALLTRGISVRVYKYSPVVPVATQARLVFTLYDLLPDLNQMYGFNFTEMDFADRQFVVTTNSPQIDGKYSVLVKCPVKPTSKSYFGTLNIVWVQRQPSLTDMLAGNKKNLTGRLYPNGNLFPDTRKPQGEWQAWGGDSSKVAASKSWNLLAPSIQIGVGSANADVASIICQLWKFTGQRDWSTKSHTTERGLGGLTMLNVKLPHKAYPEANSAQYNRAIIIPALADSWFMGNIILHYNVQV